MPVIAHNIASQFTNRQLNITTGKKTKSAEKLASGYKINRSADDAAGLQISEKMRKQVRGLNQASRNIEDGVSLCQVADGALDETTAVLQRMRELSIQSANGTNGEIDRQAIQNEIEQLTKEVDRIATTTSFNEDIYPLNGSAIKSNNIPIENDTPVDNNTSVDNNYTVINLSDLTSTLIISTDGKYSFIGETNYNVQFDDCDVDVKLSGTKFYSGMLSFHNCNVNAELDNASFFSHQISPGGFSSNVVLENCNSDIIVKDSRFEDSGLSLDGGTTNLILDNNYMTGLENALGNKLDLILRNTNTFDGTYHGNLWLGLNARNSSATVSGDGTININGIVNIDNTVINGGNIIQSGMPNNYNNSLSNTIINGGCVKMDISSSTSEVNATGNIDINGGSLEIVTSENTLYNNIVGCNINMTGGELKLESLNKTVLGNGTFNFNIADGRSGPSSTDTSYHVLLPGNSSNINPPSTNPPTNNNSTNNGSSISGNTISGSIDLNKKYREFVCIQAGSESGDVITMSMVNATAKGLHLIDPILDVTTDDGCYDAMNRLDIAIEKSSSFRSQFGAYQNRLEHAKAIDDNTAENTQYAESRIRDTDMAEEMVEHSKNNILEQVGQSMLAQANQSTQGILSLLG